MSEVARPAAGRAQPSALRSWYRAARPRTLSAAVAPVLVGSALAAAEAFSVVRFLLALAGAVLIQAGTNMLNEHYDHVQGIDLTRERRPDMVVQTGEMAHGALQRGGLVAMAAGSLCGMVLVVFTGPALLVLGALSVLAGYAYTARPLALGYRALGEVTVFIFMGPVIVAGAGYVQTERWSGRALLLSIPVGMLVAAILHVNNIRDMADDLAHGKRTLANLFGRRAAVYEYLVLTLGGYGVLAALVVARAAPPPAALALLTLPGAVRLGRMIAGGSGVPRLDRLMVGTARLHLRFGALMALGLAVDAVRTRL